MTQLVTIEYADNSTDDWLWGEHVLPSLLGLPAAAMGRCREGSTFAEARHLQYNSRFISIPTVPTTLRSLCDGNTAMKGQLNDTRP